LLANLFADVDIVWVKKLKLIGMRINLSQLKGWLPERTHNVQHPKRPAALFVSNVLQWLQSAKLLSHGCGFGRASIGHNLDSGIHWYLQQQNVATDPTASARGQGQRPAFFKAGNRKREARD
jgi:hypothetical protein